MHDIDYDKTFVSTIRINILRIVLVFIAIEDLEIE